MMILPEASSPDSSMNFISAASFSSPLITTFENPLGGYLDLLQSVYNSPDLVLMPGGGNVTGALGHVAGNI